MNMDWKYGFKRGDLEIICKVLSEAACVTKAVIFGSRAIGTFKTGSDVDLVLFCVHEKCANQVSGILNDETLLPYKFDVLDIKMIANEALLKHIQDFGIEIFSRKTEAN